jgi:hypothetical protein
MKNEICVCDQKSRFCYEIKGIFVKDYLDYKKGEEGFIVVSLPFPLYIHYRWREAQLVGLYGDIFRNITAEFSSDKD